MQLLTVKNTSQGTLPNLIIIGAMKCGTTSLHYYLNLHPQISMSQEKELKFFLEEKNWHRGVEWYKSHFTTPAQVHGESSPSYTKYPFFEGVPERMYSLIPDAKLIYIVRDPIKRIISHYVHKYANGNENRTLTEALANFENNKYISRSLYYLQLKQYLAYYPDSNILILTLEDLYHNPQLSLQKTFRFLNVDNNFSINYMIKKYHDSAVKRRKNHWGNLISKFPVINQIDLLPSHLKWHMENIIYYPFSEKIERPVLTENLRLELIDYLRQDINCLRDYTKQEFKDWCV